jgi:bifunctional non-homologous end joining protein LigD
MAEPSRVRVQVDGVQLELSNLGKVLYPAVGYTKGEVIDYYSRVAPYLLPHLTGRPLTRIRFPNGVDSASFFEKNAPQGAPSWVRIARMPVPGSTKQRELLDYVVADDLPTLVWLANLAALELHVPQWRVGAGDNQLAHPDRLVIDLDPGAPAGLPECAQVALLLRDRLAQDGLTALPKTSGRKGMQLMCALDGSRTADEVAGYAKVVAAELARAHPRLVTASMAKHLRPRKVFIDWSQNSAAKTTVAPYSLRGEREPTVSTPVTWDEVADGGVRPVRAEELLDRVASLGDLYAPLLTDAPPPCPPAEPAVGWQPERDRGHA